MVPLSLTVRNFLSYRETVSVDLSNLTIACLSGDNGAGKSALLDAMTWAIWGKSRAAREVDLISLGEDETEVTFIFAMGGREYRIMRRRTRSNRPTLEFDSRNPGTENWLPIGGDSIRDTDQRIISELRLDYETFVNSAFLQQGKADMFTENRPGDRKRILSDILDLTVYDTLASQARAEMRACQHRMDAVQTQIGRIDLLLAERHELEVTFAETEDALQAEDDALRALKANIETMQARLTAAQLTESALQRATERLRRLDAQLAELSNRKESAVKQIAQLAAVTDRDAEIRANVKALHEWRETVDKLTIALSDRQPIVKNIAELESAILRARSEIERQLAVAGQAAKTAREQLESLDKAQAQLDEREREIEAGRLETRDRAQLQAKIERDQDRLNELTAGNGTLRSRMEEISLKIEQLSAGVAICPVCRRPLADGEHEHIHEAWTQEGTQLGNAYRAAAATIATLKADISTHRHEFERLAGVSQRVTSAEAQAQQLRVQVATRPAVEQSLREATETIQRLEKMLAESGYSPAERAELKQLQDALRANPYDLDEHARARREVERLAPAEREISKLERARTEIAGLTKSIADLDEQMTQAQADVTETRAEIGELTTALEGIDQVRGEHADAVKKQAVTEESCRKLEQQRGGLARRLEELRERSDEKKELEREAKELGARIDAYRELATAFGRNGIQAMVIENVLPELEDETNRLLSRMTSKQLEVQFLTTREAVSAKSDIETLDIVIRDEAGRRPYQLFSGGEAFRINFAIRVALSKLLARRAGATVDTLIVDEGFGTQDQEGRDGLVEALQSVSRDFQLILVITHIDELRDQFPNRIEIVKTDAGSRATLI